MSSRRVLPLVLVVSGLLAVAAIAAHGRPIGHSRGTGPTPSFFDYVYTSIALAAVAIAIVFLWSLTDMTKWTKPGAQRSRFSVLQLIVSLVLSLLIGLGYARLHLHFNLQPHQRSNGQPASGGRLGPKQPSAVGRRGARLQWDEVAIVAGLLAAIGVAMFATRKAKPMKDWRFRSQEEVALALDESLDDLRTEPDVRRAIIAAYARTERALAGGGLPRRPSEAPFEYLSRALQSLHASSGAITRLTDLFERAKFSHHEPDETMREEAIDALVAVRDELRAPLATAA